MKDDPGLEEMKNPAPVTIENDRRPYTDQSAAWGVLFYKSRHHF